MPSIARANSADRVMSPDGSGFSIGAASAPQQGQRKIVRVKRPGQPA